MRSCILVLYIAVSMVPGHEVRLKADTTTDDSRSVRLQPDLVPDPLLSDAEAADRLQAADPDALYARREDLGTARRAAAFWADRLQKDPRDFESAWKLARAQYWVGKHVPKEEGKAVLESGIAAARAAVALAPSRPEGHFWLAANMGGLAESFGLRQGLKYRGEIKDELLTVLTIDPAYQQGSADRALGRWYFRVPGLFGGSNRKSEEHLRRSLTYNLNSTVSLYFLAETLMDMGRRDEARAVLQKLIDGPVNPDWGPEDGEYKEKAKRQLATLKR